MTTPSGAVVSSIHGKKLVQLDRGNLATNQDFGVGASAPIQLTSPTADGTITVGAEASDIRLIDIQLRDANGNNLNYAAKVEVIVFLDATGTNFVATGGSTGIALKAAAPAGKLLTVTAKKFFLAITDITGLLNLQWTDTGTEVAYLGVRLPTGRIIMSSALTNA